MNQVVQVGLIGYGMAGEVFHAPAIAAVPQLELTKVVERHTTKCQARYPGVETLNSVEELLKDPSIDLVVVATPNTSHFELAQKALLANKHVVVEKPFTPTSQQATELIKLAQQRNKLLSVHHNRRWDGDFLTVKQIIENSFLGKLVEYEVHFDRFRNQIKTNWREYDEPGAGILYDLGSHLIDQAVCLFGLPDTVSADIRMQRPGAKTADAFELMLNFGNLKVTAKASQLVRELGPHFILHGTAGSFIKYGMDPQEEALKQGQLPKGSNWGKESQEHWGTLNTNINGLHFYGKIETLPGYYPAYYQNIYNAIAQQEELIVKPEQARTTIQIIELAMASHAQRRTLDFY
jgi:predicted dehydrogenase